MGPEGVSDLSFVLLAPSGPWAPMCAVCSPASATGGPVAGDFGTPRLQSSRKLTVEALITLADGHYPREMVCGCIPSTSSP